MRSNRSCKQKLIKTTEGLQICKTKIKRLDRGGDNGEPWVADKKEPELYKGALGNKWLRFSIPGKIDG